MNEAYNNYADNFKSIVDKHVPVKQRKHLAKPAPFMNKALKTAIYRKRMYKKIFYM